MKCMVPVFPSVTGSREGGIILHGRWIQTWDNEHAMPFVGTSTSYRTQKKS